MRLSLIYEAGMDRRGFLKLLGKGAAASMAPPEAALKGIADIASSLGSPPRFLAWFGPGAIGLGGNDFSADAAVKLVSQYYTTMKKLGIDDINTNDRTDFIEGKISPILFQRLLPKLKEDEDHPGVYKLPVGNAAGGTISFFTSKSPLYSKKPDHINPHKTSKHIDKMGLFKRVINGMNRWADHGRDVTYSKGLEKWVLSKGWEISPTKIYKWEDFPDFIQDTIRKRIEDNPDYLDELEPGMIPPEYRSKKSNTHLEREVGYEREGQFDPQSSRPAQALGPFESRLSDAFRSIL